MIACGEVALALAGIAANAAIRTSVAGSRYDAQFAFILPIIVALLVLFMGVVALLRNDVAYAIGLVVLLALPPFYGARIGAALAVFVTTPSAEVVRSGHGFTLPADRALADAIIARDAAQVASLAPAAHLNEPGWDGQTVIRLALTEGAADYGVVAVLLRAGADRDWQAFDYAVEHKDQRLLRTTIDAGIDLNSPGERWSPRLFAGLHGWPEGLALMLEHGASPDAEDRDGNTAIVYAVDSGDWPSVDILLAHGAHIDVAMHHHTSLRDMVLKKMKDVRERGGEMPPPLAALAARFAQ